jgi:5-methylcytosine-specific restriction protein A
MVRRPCLEPGCPNLAQPGHPRCLNCTRAHRRQAGTTAARGYGPTWRRHAHAAIATHRAQHGDTCPGWARQPHAIAPSQWVCDHDLGPLCRSCNARKAATVDKARRSSSS